MLTIVYFGIPAHGHTNPSLSLVEEIINRGHKVIYYSTEEFRDKIEDAGASFREYKSFGEFDNVAAGRNLALLYYSLIYATRNMLDGLLVEIGELRPDCIIHDGICPWGRYVARILKVPVVSSVTTFAYDKNVITIPNAIRFIKKVGYPGIQLMLKARFIQNEMRAKYGVKRLEFIDTMMNEEELNIVYTSRLFQPFSEQFPQGKYAFVGPLLTQRKNDEDRFDYSALKHPIVYISMGTVWQNNAPVDLIIDALIGSNYSLVVSGSSRAYSNTNGVIIKKHINQLNVLKHADVFISHGGMNSVNESLSHEVPLCIFPFQSEQEEVAKQVVATECGVLIKKMDKKTIGDAVLTIMNNPVYKQNCRRMAASFTESGGRKVAVDRICDFISGSSNEL